MGCSGLSCTNRDSIAIFPQVSWEFGCVSPPTEFTEFTEVWGCCWLRGYGRMPYPPNLCASVPICGRCFSARRFCAFRGFCGNIVSHGFHRSTQMVGCVNSPTEFTEFTEVLGCCWQRGYGRMPYPPNLCASVRICGRYFSARRFCVFCAFCGNIVSHGFHRSTQMVCCVNSPTEFTEFTEVWGAVGCVGTAECHTLLHLCKSVLSVGATSQPEGSVCSVHYVGFIPACFVGAVLALTVGKVELRLLDSGGSVGMAGCHTLLICAHPCQSVGGTSLPEGSVCSAFCGRYFSTRRVRSVGDYSFSMRKRLTMPKTRA